MNNQPQTANNKQQTREPMASAPFFSIIVPVYNVAPYLRECLDAVLAQAFGDWECLCVDDGSTDESGEILDEYAKRDARFWVVHQRNWGLSAARNRGIDCALARAQGHYLTFIDADDWVAPNYLAAFYEGCQLQNGCCAVGVQRVYAHEKTSFDIQAVSWKAITLHAFWSSGCLPMTAWAKAFPIKCFAHCRFPKGRYHEDEATTHRLLFQYPTVATTSATLYFYRQRTSGIMGKASTVRALDLIAAHEEQVAFFVAQGYEDLADAVRCRLVYEYADAGWRLGERGYLQRLRNLVMAHSQLTPFSRVNHLTLWLTAYVHYPFCRCCDILRRRGLVGAVKQFCCRFKRG